LSNEPLANNSTGYEGPSKCRGAGRAAAGKAFSPSTTCCRRARSLSNPFIITFSIVIISTAIRVWNTTEDKKGGASLVSVPWRRHLHFRMEDMGLDLLTRKQL